MVTPADVRGIALSLPAAEQAADRFAFSVRVKGKLKGFAWDFPAVLVRLDAVTIGDLKRLLTDAWRCQAPVDLTGRVNRRRK